MLGINFGGAVVRRQRVVQVARDVGHGPFLVPGLRGFRRQRQRLLGGHTGLLELPGPDADGHFSQPDGGQTGVNGARVFNGFERAARVSQVRVGACFEQQQLELNRRQQPRCVKEWLLQDLFVFALAYQGLAQHDNHLCAVDPQPQGFGQRDF